jgi:hypothetical protein
MEIPGMYYDEEKNKYFAIQKNHHVPPGSKYTAADVLRRNEIKLERKLRLERDLSNKNRQPIPPRKRSKILETWNAMDLARSDGSLDTSQSRQALVNSYVKTFGPDTPGDGSDWSKSRHSFPAGTPTMVIDLSVRNKHHPESGLSSHPPPHPRFRDGAEIKRWEIACFAWDPLLRCLYISAVKSHYHSPYDTPRIFSASLNFQDPFRVRSPQSLMNTMWSETVSCPDIVSFQVQLERFRVLNHLNIGEVYLPSHWQLGVTTSHSLVALDGAASTFREFMRFPRHGLDVRRWIPNPRPDSSHHNEICIGQENLLCVAPNPWRRENKSETSETVAFGTPDGVLVFEAFGRLTDMHSGFQCDWDDVANTYSDVISLEWMSRDIIAAGLRNSGIILHDRRANGTVIRLRHSGSVIRLARANESGTRLVACGIPSVMSMYDLRMVKQVTCQSPRAFAYSMRSEEKSARQDGKRQKTSVKASNYPRTEPVFSFDYRNKTKISIGFDVSRDWGLLAAANDTGSIQLYSLRDGKKVKELSFPAGAAPKAYDYAPNSRPTIVKCLKFVDDDSGLRILASYGSAIHQFGILENDDIDEGHQYEHKYDRPLDDKYEEEEE